MIKTTLMATKGLQLRILLVILFLGIFCFTNSYSIAEETKANVGHQPIVEKLISILEKKSGIEGGTSGIHRQYGTI